MILANHGIIRAVLGGVSDPDAQAFITAAGITDNTQKDAINTLVIALKADSLWTKLNAIYPFVGGSATTHKFNLKDPRDLDAAFRLTFFGGWTHSSTGALPNGTTGYANTHLNPYTVIGATSGIPSQMSVYSRTNSAGIKVLMGQYVSGSSYNELIPLVSPLYWDYPNGSRLSATVTNSLGYYIGYNNSTNGKDLWQSTTNRINGAHSNDVFCNAEIQLSQWGNSTRYSDHELAFATVGNDVWDSTMVSNLYTAVQAFQTSLSRQV